MLITHERQMPVNKIHYCTIFFSGLRWPRDLQAEGHRFHRLLVPDQTQREVGPSKSHRSPSGRRRCEHERRHLKAQRNSYEPPLSLKDYEKVIKLRIFALIVRQVFMELVVRLCGCHPWCLNYTPSKAREC